MWHDLIHDDQRQFSNSVDGHCRFGTCNICLQVQCPNNAALPLPFFYSRDDLARAIKKLHVMGSGFQVIPAGNKRLVQSVPGELSMDHTAALQLAQVIVATCQSIETCSLWRHKQQT